MCKNQTRGSIKQNVLEKNGIYSENSDKHIAARAPNNLGEQSQFSQILVSTHKFAQISSYSYPIHNEYCYIKATIIFL